MAFTYDLDHATEAIANQSKVRLEIGDTVIDEGPRPNGANFQDDEVAYWLESEGDHIMRATAAACETLARQWSLIPTTRLGPHGESASDIAKAYAERAKQLREEYGRGNTTGAFAFAVGTVPSNPADTGGEYSV